MFELEELKFNGSEIELIYFILYKYDLYEKISWIKKKGLKDRLYIMINDYNSYIKNIKDNEKLYNHNINNEKFNIESLSEEFLRYKNRFNIKNCLWIILNNLNFK